MRNPKLYPLFGLLLAAALLLSVFAGGAFAQGTTPTAQPDEKGETTRTLSVSGSGRAYLTPDIAYVTIGVHTEGKDASEAVAANNTRADRLMQALRRFGVAERDMQTTNFSIYPQQEYDNQGKPTGEINYVVDNAVNVTVRDLSTIGPLLDEAVRAGANSINGIQFDVADKTAALSEARRSAVENARAQAEELAGAAGVTLGAIQTINSYGGYQPPTPVYQARAAMDMEAAAVPISTGEMVVTVEVSIVYEIQ